MNPRAFVQTMIALASASLGLVAAPAWNEAIKATLKLLGLGDSLLCDVWSGQRARLRQPASPRSLCLANRNAAPDLVVWQDLHPAAFRASAQLHALRGLGQS